jgi:hypothetical protein
MKPQHNFNRGEVSLTLMSESAEALFGRRPTTQPAPYIKVFGKSSKQSLEFVRVSRQVTAWETVAYAALGLSALGGTVAAFLNARF